MIRDEPYVYIETTARQAAVLSPEFTKQAEEKWLCPGKFHIRANARGVDVKVVSSRLGRGALNFVNLTGLGLVGKDFLQDFGDDLVDRNLYLGRVSDRDGDSQIWATYRGRRLISVRGTDHSGSRRCEYCGLEISFALKPSYLWPPPDPDIQMFDYLGTGLVVTREVASMVNFKKWRGMRLYGLRVAEPPE